MTLIATQTNQILDLWFAEAGDSRSYKLRIANPKPGLQAREVQAAALGIVNSHALDFNGTGQTLRVLKAHYVTTDRQIMIKN